VTAEIPVVLLPGMNCTPRLWAPVLPALRGRTVHHGELLGASLEQCVENLLAVLPERFALAGLSLGGIVAMALLRTAPERVDRLCLLDTNARAPEPVQFAAFARQRRRLATGASAQEVQRELLDVLVHPRHLSRLGREVVRMGEETGVDSLAQQYAIQGTRRDERDHLPGIGVPVSVVAGRDDALCPPERHEEITALVPDATLRLIPRTGHLSPLESPTEVAKSLVAWLER